MRIGQVFRYPKQKNRNREKIDGFPNFSFYTNCPNENLVLLEKGINPIGLIKNKSIHLTPAIITSTSPHKIGSADTPWQDFYNVSKGHIRYFGDNKGSSNPENKAGNKALLKQFELHNSSDPDIRKTASPIIFFKRVPINNAIKGFVEFNGFGVITNAERVVQHNRRSNSDFVNYSFDFAVLDISQENEEFNWEWINSRRDKSKTLDETMDIAPSAWKYWVKNGNGDIEKVRRNVSKLQVLSTSEQKPQKNSRDLKTLQEIYNFYSKTPASKKRFENLASIVTEHLIRKSSSGYKSGWITKGSGDSGIDFIGRMDIGSGFGSAKVIVLGQAKCESLSSPTGGTHIARTVAKLKRGWLGVYVTTSYFSDKVQIEILEDKYPLLLINGRILSQEVNEIILEQAYKNVKEYLEDIDKKYEGAIKFRDPEEILFDR